MSKIKMLINEFCPEGVIYKSLGELGVFFGGITGKSKNDFIDGNAIFISYKNVYSNPSLDINPDDRVKIEPNEKQRTLEYGDVIFTGSSETPDECGISSVITEHPNENLYLNSFCFVFRFNEPEIMDPNFAKHLFRSSALRYQIGKTASGVTRYNVSKKLMANVVIPLPPIEVQKEIVKILDSYQKENDELLECLKAEIEDRNLQYIYYKDKLLPFDNTDVRWLELGQIAKIARGASPRPIKNFVTDDINGVNWIKIGDVAPGEKYITSCAEKITAEGAKKSRLVRPGDFILSNSMSFGRPYILKIEGCIHDGWLSISEFDEFVTADYLYYILTSDFIQKVMKKKASFGGAVQNLNADIVRGIEIPVPSKDAQRKIVEILDEFSLVNQELIKNLNDEVHDREKQYAYYSNCLMSFN